MVWQCGKSDSGVSGGGECVDSEGDNRDSGGSHIESTDGVGCSGLVVFYAMMAVVMWYGDNNGDSGSGGGVFIHLCVRARVNGCVCACTHMNVCMMCMWYE